MSVIPEENSDKSGPQEVILPTQTKSGIVNKEQQMNICTWLSKNGPRDAGELDNLRYVINRRCSHADFVVTEQQDNESFVLSGRQGSVHIASNAGCGFLLWRLDCLADEWMERDRDRLRGNQKPRIIELWSECIQDGVAFYEEKPPQ